MGRHVPHAFASPPCFLVLTMSPPLFKPSAVPDAPAAEVPTVAQRLRHLALNAAVFAVAYSFNNLMAQQRGTAQHIATAWDAHVPLLPWLLLPYASSGVLWVWGFAGAVSVDALRAFSHRLLLSTVVAGVVFALWPLRFVGDTAAALSTVAPVWVSAFAWLSQIDPPYNQCPSLHVAYAVVLWPTLAQALHQRTRRWSAAMQRLARLTLAGWLGLLAVSTVFTYQHHVWDVPAGILLGLGVVRGMGARPGRGPWVWGAYAVAAGLLVVVALNTCGPISTAGGFSWPVAQSSTGLLLVWTAFSCGAVALAYARGDAGFLHKRSNGTFPIWVWLLYGPYLGGYRLTWWAVCWRERHHPPVQRLPCAPWLWVGRRLTAHEARTLLPAGVCVIDLANELPETRALRPRQDRGRAAVEGVTRYQAFALLDLQPMPTEQQISIFIALNQLKSSGRGVYVHCSMGYARSRHLVAAYLASPFFKDRV
jgi:PAP2 superfamily